MKGVEIVVNGDAITWYSDEITHAEVAKLAMDRAKLSPDLDWDWYDLEIRKKVGNGSMRFSAGDSIDVGNSMDFTVKFINAPKEEEKTSPVVECSKCSHPLEGDRCGHLFVGKICDKCSEGTYRWVLKSIDDLVDEWYTSPDDGTKLYEYLGWTEEEYAAWVKDPNAKAKIHQWRDVRGRKLSPEQIERLEKEVESVLLDMAQGDITAALGRVVAAEKDRLSLIGRTVNYQWEDGRYGREPAKITDVKSVDGKPLLNLLFPSKGSRYRRMQFDVPRGVPGETGTWHTNEDRKAHDES